MGKIKFLRRFVPNFIEIIKHITNILRKDGDIKWIEDAKKYFTTIKLVLTEDPILINLDYSKEFYIFSFALEDTIVVVLFP